MGDFARLMIGIFLMLVTTGAACSLAVMQYASAMNRRVCVTTRDVFESRHSDRLRRTE